MSNLDVTLPLSFYFDTTTPVPIPEIITSLEGLERLSRSLPRFLSSISGAEVDRVELQVDSIETGSLKEALDCVVSFLTPQERDKFKAWAQGTKMGTAVRYAACGGVVAVALTIIAVGAISAYDTFSGAKTPSIQANHNTIINIGADALSASEDQVRKAIDAALSQDKKRAVAAAMSFIAPAGSVHGGTLYAGEKGAAVSISHEMAKDTPAAPDFKAKDQVLSYSDVAVSIRALDRDKGSGWWVVLPTIAADRRLRMTFADGVDSTKAMTDADIKADVIVTYSQDFNQGTLVPKGVEVQKIH